MHYTQNQKISQITPSTLIIGIDIAKDKHVARAQDDRGIEFGKRLVFDNRIHGFQLLLDWMERHQKNNGKKHVIFGVEPTGHYWLNLAYFLRSKGFDFVLVNPMHVKKSKELDDNSPTKNDTKECPCNRTVNKGWPILRTEPLGRHLCRTKRRRQTKRSADQATDDN